MFEAPFIGHLFEIRSDRQSVREIEVNIAYRNAAHRSGVCHLDPKPATGTGATTTQWWRRTSSMRLSSRRLPEGWSMQRGRRFYKRREETERPLADASNSTAIATRGSDNFSLSPARACSPPPA
jgi:hypothetical protein